MKLSKVKEGKAMNYQTIEAQLQGRNKESRKCGNNTYLVRRPDYLALRYHQTDVVKYYPDARIELDSGGWRTLTTKDRINRGLPPGYRLTQASGVWFLNEEPYQDGITITKSGQITGHGTYNPKADKALKRRVKEYASKCAQAVPLDRPDGGDCWYCNLVTEGGQTLGDAAKDTEHLMSHIEAGYVVPSLVYRAIEENYNAPMAFWQAFKDTGWSNDREFGRQAVRKAVYRYILKRMGFAI